MGRNLQERKVNSVTIIGAGKLGTTLGAALRQKNYRIRALFCRSSASVLESREIIGEGLTFTEAVRAAAYGRIVILALPDDVIEKTAADITPARKDWSRCFVFHCSGLISSQALLPLKERGARTASIHPVQSFACKSTDPKIFQGIYFGCEGDARGMAGAQSIVEDLGGRVLTLEPQDKPLYHAACSLASNFLVVLLDAAARLLQQTGDYSVPAKQVLLPLLKGTLQNVNKLSIISALTGPIARGDEQSVARHMEALKAYPRQKQIYRHLGLAALESLKNENKLSPRKIKALKARLEGK